MDDLTLIQHLHSAERPPSLVTAEAARRRLVAEATGRRRHRRIASLPRPNRTTTLIAAATACILAGGTWTAYRGESPPLVEARPSPLGPLVDQNGPASTFLLAAADAKTRRLSNGRLWYVHRVVGESAVVSSTRHHGVHYTVQITKDTYDLSAKSAKEFGPLRGEKSPSTGLSWDDPHVGIRPATPADGRAWKADHQPGASRLGLKSPDVEHAPFRQEGAELDFGAATARRLPTDPSKLRAWLLDYATRPDHKALRDPDLYLFQNAPALLADRAVSDRVRIATYRMLARLRNAKTINAEDAAGQRGQGVAMRQTTRDYGTIEWQLLIDPATGRLTASQAIVVTHGPKNAGMRPGTRQYFEIVKAADWTNAPRDSLLPKWILDPTQRP
ncbi:hypothetical protein [Actinomadura violacea]|uniref:CU044_5270 family protein n=1 Tax=Actinomadura violacea TaxID=2819934 RepID=A0ABS3RP01_9ACTN|nr:hypothetical protein [Actinomadura violacea]MBO2457779.1 hypothetical protein [Actinomadura violacea]